jgi:alpha-acetolactate decarboxylase
MNKKSRFGLIALLLAAATAFAAEPFAVQASGHHGSGMHDQGHAQAKTFREMGVSGTLLGFHTGAALEGTASHPGERFHVHYANPDMSVSGHVDEYRVPGGAMLMLPRR